MPRPEHAPELVVLLDEAGAAVGSAPKTEVHGRVTPLHLAFSCYLLDGAGDVLVTRRALTKPTWPGVWTNSFCGHPAPGEGIESAVARRAAEELAVGIASLRAALPDFRYRAVDAGGIEENEICPVFLASAAGDVAPDPAEVAEWAWVRPEALARAVTLAPFAFSPWMREQLPRLMALEALSLERA